MPKGKLDVYNLDITDIKRKKGKYVLIYKDGVKIPIPYSEGNRKIISDIILNQEQENIKNKEKIVKKIGYNFIALVFAEVLFLSFSFIVLVDKVPFGTYIYIILFTQIPSIINLYGISMGKTILKQIEKARLFIEKEEMINAYIKENEVVFKILNRKSKRAIKEDDSVVNMSNLMQISLKDLKKIIHLIDLNNISSETKLEFQEDSILTPNKVLKKNK